MSRDGAATPPVAARDLPAFVSRWLPFASALAHRRRLVNLAALGGVFAVAVLSYWWTEAPLYNPFGTVDPWLYTALFVNFDRVYEPFANTYYAARLPWIVPGRLAYGVLPVDAANWLLHGLMFAAGVAAVFYLVRRYLGLTAAVVGATTLALSQMYWNAQYWDYIDGVALTYALLGLCLGLPLLQGVARAASLFAAGVFFTAAVTTNPFVALVALTYPIQYALVQPANGLRQRLILWLKDLVALAAGTLALVIALGFYASSNGGPFRFFQPQLDFIRAGTGGVYKAPGYEWIRNEPRLLVPLFLLVVSVPFLVLGRRLPPFRFAAGAVGGLAFLTAVIYGWELFAGGAHLEYSWYFSYFAGSIALTLAAIAALALALVRSHWSANVGVTAAAIGAAVVALGLIYRSDRVEWTAAQGGRISVWVIIVAAGAIILALATLRTRAGALACSVAIGAAAFASHFATSASSQTFLYGSTAPPNGGLYQAAIDNVEFVNESTKQGDPFPGFWYRATNPTFVSIQSMYFFSFTAVGWDLPKVTGDMRHRLAAIKPQTIVMLCETRSCGGGARALRRAGYPYAPERVKRISRGDVRLWAVLLRSEPASCPRDRAAVQSGDLLRAPPASEVYVYWGRRKHWIASVDVLLEVFGPNALGAVKDISPQVLGRLAPGRTIRSVRGWVEISGRRSVLPRSGGC